MEQDQRVEERREMSRLAVIVELLLNLVNEVISQVKKAQKKKAESKYQKEVLDAEKDVVSAFNEHFSPVLCRDKDEGSDSSANKTSDRSEKGT